MSTAIQQVQPQQQITQWKSPSAVKSRIEAIQQLMRDVLKPATKESGWDGDYGVIPGTGTKPSLLKAGSEQILAMFEIAVDPVVEDLSTEDCSRYRVTARLIHVPSGNFLGAGIGEASTNETKYKWKKTWSKPEYESTDPDRRRIKHSQYKNNNGMFETREEMQIRQEPADLANTVLKMAKKRAQIDATLTVTGASSMFVQDVEESVEDGSPEPPKAIRGRKPTQGTPTPPQREKVVCASCGATDSHAPSCKFHPKNVSSGGQPAGGSQKNPSNEGPKQEVKGEVMPKTVRGMYVVKSHQVTKSGKGLELTVVNEDNKEGRLYVWHKHLQAEPCDLKAATGKLCDLELSASTKKNPQGEEVTFYSVEHVHLIGAVPYIEDKPAQSPSAKDVGFEAPMDEEMPW
jgi:hypothetical protein